MENINALTSQPVSNETLKSIAQLAELQLAQEKEVDALEKALETAKAKLAETRDNLLPGMMSGVGMSQFKLNDGTIVAVQPFYAAKIPDDKQTEAMRWIRKDGSEEIIKHEIKCNLGKGDDTVAKLIAEQLKALRVDFTDKEYVHPMTLKAFVKEKIESGKALPNELFGVFVGSRAKITPAK